MRHVFYLILSLIFIGCSVHKNTYKYMAEESYILSYSNNYHNNPNPMDDIKTFWYLESGLSGDLELFGNKFKAYYFHFFYDIDRIYACCLDDNKEKLVEYTPENEYELMQLQDILKKGYSFFTEKERVIIYKIDEIEGCKCGKERVFPNDRIKDFYIPIKLKIKSLNRNEKRFFKKNIDTISKHFDMILGIDK